MPIKLSDLAQKINCRLHGEDCLVENVADINHAGNGDLVFISNAQYKAALSTTGASAVICREECLDNSALPALLTDDPRLAFAKAATLLNPAITDFKGVDPTAVISSEAHVDESASLDANVVIKGGATIGANTFIGAGTVIGENVRIGDRTQLNANVTVYANCVIGNDCILRSGVVIGADGFGFVRDGSSYFKVPQLGCVHVGNDVEIGANTTIDRGALLDTLIGDGVKLDNLIQIGHNVEIGEHTVISACSSIGGTVKIGKFCLIGGNVGVRDNIQITDNVMITARTFVTGSITKPGSYSSSTPMDETASWRKNTVRFRKLDEMFRRLVKLEKKLSSSDND